MSRLTARTENGNAYLVNVKPDEQEVDSPRKNTFQCILDCFERLAQYEDLEEQGRLVVLPCKVGDTVYFIREEYVGNNSIQDNEVFEIKLDSRGVVFYGVPRRCSMDFMCYIEDLGETVFLTREEAEAALKGGAQ